MAQTASKEILVQRARLAFGDGIFVRKPFGGDSAGKADYNAKFIIPTDHKQIDQLRKLEEEIAKDKWGAKAADILKRIRAKDTGLVHDGDTQRSDGFAGNLFLSARSDSRPTTIDRQRNTVAQEDGVIYSGCYVNVRLGVWAQDNQYGKRINAQLLGVQFVADGDSFSAGAPPANPDDFPDLGVDGDEEADPFA